MPTTCPRCGTRSPETSQSCRECGRDLYRVSYPATPGTPRLGLRIDRLPTRMTVGLALLVVGAGVSAGFLLQGQDEEPTSKGRIPAQAVPHEPTPSVTPSSAEPSKTKAPPKPAPTTTQPRVTPTPTPTPTQTYKDPFAEIPEAQRALEFADEVTREWASPGPTNWGQSDGY
ncbi:hypothetical protein [Streptomyces winkii]|uniref:hypothetical protein n=1 Tax=Streptomyces winkii TaxID=3051178 RepID=UPI0028D05A37|nr:hypothetical protein [Streptomyces sp. DSM 40971]